MAQWVEVEDPITKYLRLRVCRFQIFLLVLFIESILFGSLFLRFTCRVKPT